MKSIFTEKACRILLDLGIYFQGKIARIGLVGAQYCGKYYTYPLDRKKYR